MSILETSQQDNFDDEEDLADFTQQFIGIPLMVILGIPWYIAFKACFDWIRENKIIQPWNAL